VPHTRERVPNDLVLHTRETPSRFLGVFFVEEDVRLRLMTRCRMLGMTRCRMLHTIDHIYYTDRMWALCWGVTCENLRDVMESYEVAVPS
jgi:hypothetical protein